jgi:hypothetical protein
MKSSISQIKRAVESLSSRLDKIEDRLLGLNDKADVLEHADKYKFFE